MNNTQKYLTPPEVLAVPATASVARLGSIPAWVLLLGTLSDCGESNMKAIRAYETLVRMGVSESVRHIATHVANVGGHVHSVLVIGEEVVVMSIFRNDDNDDEDRCKHARLCNGTVEFKGEIDTLTETIIDIRNWISEA